MIKELLEYIWKEKKWWLIPPLIILAIFGLIMAFSATSPISPFIYMFF